MENAVEDRRGDDAISEHVAPAAERLSGGEDERALLVAPTNKLEEQVRSALIDRQVAVLIDDEEPSESRQ